MLVIDYCERRQSRKPVPPKRPSIWPSLMLIAFLMFVSFAAGLGSGWYLLRPGGRFYRAPVAPPPVAQPKKTDALPPQGQPVVPASQQSAIPPGEKGNSAPPLTFYNTLQKGNKGLMGTGINQPKEGQPPHPLPQTSPQAPERQ